jgi:hypothetical protein
VGTGKQGDGQLAIIEAMRSAEAYTGTSWYYGTREGYQFCMSHDAPARHWRITAADAGEEAVFQADRGTPAVGGNDSGIITHVRARYTDSMGIGRYTPNVATGLYLPRMRVETIDAASEETAVDEAAARATFLGQRVRRGTFVVKDSISLFRGGQRNVAAARAGDWATVDTISLGQRITHLDLTRGGIIGKTTYDGDANEITIELLGTREQAR